jgi:uncharacterized protein
MPTSQPTCKPESSPAGASHRFHAMVKPVGARCNLNCSYCFYLHKAELLEHEGIARMSDEVLEQHIRQYIEGQTGDEVIFSWQGGEPTLAGMDFYRKIVQLQAKYKKPHQRIENDLQTNGILLNEEWAAFLKQYNFLVGLSIDGPRELHDRYRLTRDGRGTFDKVMAAAKLLHQYKVPFNGMCTVNRENALQPVKVYRFLLDELKVWRVQFTPCVEPRVFMQVAPQHWGPLLLPTVGSPQARPGSEDSAVTDWSVDPEDWGRFLSDIWDEWYQRDYGNVHVNLFETAVAQSLELPSQTCAQAEFCGKGLAVEHNGDVFACDHYVYPEYRRGNILTTHLATIAYGEGQKRWGFSKRDDLPSYCRQCPHLKLCWGECPKNRLVRAPDGEPGLNYLCPGYKMFYDHIQRDLPEILRRVKAVQGW